MKIFGQWGLALLLALSGCTMFGPPPEKDSDAYHAGYIDGCSTGQNMASGFGNLERDSDHYRHDSDYRAGWDEGFRKCRPQAQHKS